MPEVPGVRGSPRVSSQPRLAATLPAPVCENGAPALQRDIDHALAMTGRPPSHAQICRMFDIAAASHAASGGEGPRGREAWRMFRRRARQIPQSADVLRSVGDLCR
eukprot:gene39184-35124_t